MQLLVGMPPLEVEMRRSARARRMSLRVSRLDGRVTLSLPLHARESEAMAFVNAQEGWIRNALADVSQASRVRFGAMIPVEGHLVEIQPGAGRAPMLRDGALLVPGDAARVGARVAAWMKLRARERLATASDHYARAIGRRYMRLTLRDTRSRWGSCTADAGLMYSWRLIMAPPEVLEYVVVHEVAHLAQMNHSPAFWAIVADLMPDYKRRRRWLKSEGHALHSWQFD